jgi:heterotetrameric sarcosine oxidase gamma subunit
MAYQIEIQVDESLSALAVRTGSTGRSLLDKALGVDLPAAGEVGSTSTLRIYSMAMDEWLLVSLDSDESLESELQLIDTTLAGQHGAVARTGAAWSRAFISGPDVYDVMAQCVAVDLQSKEYGQGRAWRGGFGQTNALIHHRDAHSFDIICDMTVRRYCVRFIERCRGI